MINNIIMLNNRNIKTFKLNKSLNYKNLKIFKIIKFHELIYKLKFLTSMKRLYFIFHLWLFHLNNNNLFLKQRIILLLFIDIDEKNEIKKIKKIVKFKIDKKMKDFIINKKRYFIYKIKYIELKTYNNSL